MSGHLELGRFGEEAAAGWYRSHGYQIVDRNWTCPSGEIDLVVSRMDGSGVVLAFVEVKTRRSNRYGSGFDAVTVDKQRRLRALAGEWLRAGRVHPDRNRRCGHSGGFTGIRFDVVDVDGHGHVQVLEGAF